MTKPIRKLVASNGEYTKDGVTKTRWQRIGTMFKDDENGNISIKVDVIPVGPEWSGWVKAFPMDEDAPRQQQPAEPTTTRNVHDQANNTPPPQSGDDIPF